MPDPTPETSFALSALLEKALGDTEARIRRTEAHRRDKRTESMVLNGYEGLDQLIQMLEQAQRGKLPPALELTPLSEPDVDSEPEESIDSEELNIEFLPVTADDDAIEAPEIPQEAKEDIKPQAAEVRSVPSTPFIRNDRHHHILLEDVKRLYRIKDREGMLVSLERLMITGSQASNVIGFIEEQQDALLNVYESFLGPFTKTVRRKNGSQGMPDSYMNRSTIQAVWNLTNEDLSVETILAQSELSQLQTCCVLSQLQRAGAISIGAGRASGQSRSSSGDKPEMESSVALD